MSRLKKIVIPGGTGQVGAILARAFHAKGAEVIVLGRTPVKVPWRFVPWDGKSLGEWTRELEGADAVINLAGRSVNCRYSKANRRLIKDSRVDSARVVGEAIRKTSCPPPVWLQMSTATIYAHRYDAPNDEATGILGGNEPGVPETWRFSIDVAKSWEAAARAAKPPWTRLVLLRSAMVMSPDSGGVFATLSRLVRLGLGGHHGDGRQYMSWIHETDFIRAIEMVIANDSIAGPVNLSAPNPLPDAEFMASLRQAWDIPIGLPATNTMLEIGAFFLRTETELILKSRRVRPGLLLRNSFEFQFPRWRSAASDLVHRRQLLLFPVKAVETARLPVANEPWTMRLVADILRYIQIVMLVPFGLVGLLVLPGEIEQISVYSQWYPVYQQQGKYFQPYLSQVAGHEMAVYCITLGWALLVALIAMQWFRSGWRCLIWIVILLHNFFILTIHDWPYHPIPTLIPEVVIALSALSLLLDFIGIFEKQTRPSI